MNAQLKDCQGQFGHAARIPILIKVGAILLGRSHKALVSQHLMYHQSLCLKDVNVLESDQEGLQV